MSGFIGPVLPHPQREVESGESRATFESNESQMGQDLDGDSIIRHSLPTRLIQRVDSPSVPYPTNKGTVQAPEISLSFPPHFPAECPAAVSPADSTGAPIASVLPPHHKEGTEMGNLESQSSHKISILPLSKETDATVDNSLRSCDADEEVSSMDPQDEMYGPALPPGLRLDLNRASTGATSRGILGPQLPAGMKLDESVDARNSDGESGDVVGPMPTPKGASSGTYCQDQLDDRALRMKRALAGENMSCSSGTMKRESWMLELPPDREADFGLGPRQFRARAKPEPGDRSVWTDTPADRLQKKLSPEDKRGTSTFGDMELTAIQERDKAMQHLVEQHSGKRTHESLLQTHQKEAKRKREKAKVEERRPFDRDVDLQARRFDEAQKKAIFKKAQLLNDRFSSGRSKFL